MPSCCVFSCKRKSQTSNLKKDGITFHLFPNDPFRRKAWIEACGNHVTWLPKRTSTICSEHFDRGLFIMQSNNKRKLCETAVPTLKLLEVEEPPKVLRVDVIGQPSDILQLAITLETASSTYESTLDPEPENTSTSFTYKSQETPRERKLKQSLKKKTMQVKRLHSQIRYLKSKVVNLQEALNSFSEK